MTRIAQLIAGTAIATTALLSGCASAGHPGVAQPLAGAGAASAQTDPGGDTDTDTRTGATGSTAGTTGTCDDRTYSDPWIAFTPSLSDGDRLELGDKGWLSGVDSVEDIEVSGETDAVVLTEQSAPTEIACGQVVGSVDWIQVEAAGLGTVTLTTADSSLTIEVIVY